jgi:hypothetical protein
VRNLELNLLLISSHRNIGQTAHHSEDIEMLPPTVSPADVAARLFAEIQRYRPNGKQYNHG